MKISNTKNLDLESIHLYLQSKAQSTKIIKKDSSLFIIQDVVRAELTLLNSTEIEIKCSPNFKNLQNAITMAIPAAIGASYGGFIIGFLGALLGGGLTYLINNGKMKQFEGIISKQLSEMN